MNLNKCSKCGWIGGSQETRCRDCCTLLTPFTPDPVEKKSVEREDYSKTQTQDQAQARSLFAVPNKINLPARISFLPFVIGLFIFALINLNSMMTYTLLAFTATIGLLLAINGYTRATQKSPIYQEKGVAIAAIIINGLILQMIISMVTLDIITTPLTKFVMDRQEQKYLSDENWKTHNSKSGLFKIKIPGQPSEKFRYLQTPNGPAVSYTSELIQRNGSSCAVAVTEYLYKNARLEYSSPSYLDTILNDAVDGVVSRTNAKLVASRPINLGHSKGIEADYFYSGEDSPKGENVTFQFYFIEQKLYALVVSGNDQTPLYHHRARFFNSFEIVGINKENPAGAAAGDENIGKEYQRALEIGKRAQELSHTADNKDDWEMITYQLYKAIKILEQIKASSSNYLETEKLLDTYLKDIKVAAEKRNIGGKLTSNYQPFQHITDKTVYMPLERSSRRYASVSTNLKDYADLQGNFSVEGNELFVLPESPSGSINFLLKVKGKLFKVLCKTPDDKYLKVGSYSNALNTNITDKVMPALSIDGVNTNCRYVNSSFTINQINYDTNNQLQLLDATFEQRCYEHGVIVAGRVHYDTAK